MSRAKSRREPGGTPVIPLRYGDDALLWAAWLYYEEGLTQNEIAKEMGISRPTVNTYLAEARDTGVVEIAINSDRMRCLSLARQVAEHFGLSDCMVIPSRGGSRSLIDRLGSAGAQAIARHLRSGMTLAVSWGRTMYAVAAAMESDGNLRDLSVVQTTGGTTERVDFTPEACARLMADRLDARCIPISAPALVSTRAVRDTLLSEGVIAEQIEQLGRADCIVFGVSSLRPDSTLHVSGLIDEAIRQHETFSGAVGSLVGRLIDSAGRPVEGPLDARIIGLPLDDLKRRKQKIAVAGSVDKVPAILATLRGGYADILVTDAETANGLLRADGEEPRPPRSGPRRAPPTPADAAPGPRRIKKFLNAPHDAVDEALQGALASYPGHLRALDDSGRSLVATRDKAAGKVGIVIGGGAGHEPCFFGFVGRGLADAVAVGNVFASPPPDRVLLCSEAAHRGAGLLYIYGNYTGDIMNFDMAAEMAAAQGIDVRTVLTTDDAAYSAESDRAGRRGTAGNLFVFKIAGAAAERGLPLDETERLARKANANCHTMGIALDPCSMPESLGPSFPLGGDEIEVGVGIHGEPGITREAMMSADDATDRIMDRLIDDAALKGGERVALLVNSLGATPMLELFILARRATARLKARGVTLHDMLVGHYCTSLNMTGASITLLHLDRELQDFYDDPCDGFAWRRGVA
ncbi:bifunctional sugar-binding transcriptional regulator/dihydroxyacetone kinase subunit DhaK [Tranquillimonas rosea]|uniref:bifunctional sugar-binding transcriptional regulator/dihydroxyacetone kinase subunit DhaK n=1 Tax=Tranquillimonas rosea TaxID=641238 RepID=UPI003BA9861D